MQPATPNTYTPSAMMLARTRHGQFVVNSNDIYIGQALLFYGEYCEAELNFLKHFIKEGDTVIDVGANIGAFTVPLAHHTGTKGRVFAFEPQPLLFHCLQQNGKMNACNNITYHQIGAGAHEETLEMDSPDYSQWGNFGAVSLTRLGQGMKVHVRPLDDVLGGTPVHFIKIDVEGMERDVLLGATYTLKHHRPILYIENDRQEKSAALITTIIQANYRLWWHAPPLFNPDNYLMEEKDIYGGKHCLNMICMPREKADFSALNVLTEIKDPHTAFPLI